MAVTTSYGPIYVGQTAPALLIRLTTDGNNGADLTGLDASALSMSIKNNTNSVVTAGQGTFTIIQAAPSPAASDGTLGAVVQYQLAAADVAASGAFTLYVNVQFSNGSDVFGPLTLNISAK